MNNKGSILAISIIFIFIFMLLGMFAMRLVILQNEQSDEELYYTRTHFAAIYATEVAFWRIMQWQNIPTASTATLNPDGRKFLAQSPDCFSYDGKWHPLKDYTGNVDINSHFSDSLSSTDKTGISVECEVELDVAPVENDGYIPDPNPNSLARKYGTYKFYIIKTKARMFADISKANEATPIATADDQMYFMIAYSTGPAGARAWTGFVSELEVQTAITALSNDPKMIAAYPNATTRKTEATKRIQEQMAPFTSAPSPSFITGKVQPIFRYYIRGRR